MSTSGFVAAKRRSSKGSDKTHYRKGTLGTMRSTKHAASLHMRRVSQLGQSPRALHEKATCTSCPQASQWHLTKPRALDRDLDGILNRDDGDAQ